MWLKLILRTKNKHNRKNLLKKKQQKKNQNPHQSEACAYTDVCGGAEVDHVGHLRGVFVSDPEQHTLVLPIIPNSCLVGRIYYQSTYQSNALKS